MGPDFSGWATKYGVKCSDGRTIMPDAFAHADQKAKVPLVWKHGHDDSDNILGHAILTPKPEGIWADGYFNDNPKSQNMKRAVKHDDIDSLSIWANQLAEKAKQVFHGVIREVSLVMAGANSEARIMHVNLEHSADGGVEFVLAHEDESDDILIFPGDTIRHDDESSDEEESDEDESTDDEQDEESDESVEHSEDNRTIADVLETLNDEQKNAFAYVVSQLTHEDEGDEHSDSDTEDDEGDLNHQEGNQEMTRNVFEQNGQTGTTDVKDNVLSHDEMQGIFRTALSRKQTLKEAVEDYALQHGIEDIDTLFPNFKDLDSTPQFISRRMEWVANVINGVSHSPFSRIRTRFANITQEEARAKGYIKGHLKKEEFFSVSKRETSPTTIYKKQKLDRDDILDITDFNVVTWVQAEMKVMLQEEVARAILLGDGRAADDEDKIKEPQNTAETGTGIRSILNDHELYTITENLDLLDANSDYNEFVDGVASAMQYYRGTGSPTLYMTLPNLTKILLARDTLKRRIYQTKADVAAAMGVGDIQTVEVMEEYPNVLGIVVNLTDYTVGTDSGGEVSFFDFFDIDYNQYKYLYETRFSGALTRYRSAIVLMQSGTGSTTHLSDPTAPTFDLDTGVVTIPTTANVVYHQDSAGGATLSAGPQTALTDGQSLHVVAVPASGYDFPDNVNDDWTFEMPPA